MHDDDIQVGAKATAVRDYRDHTAWSAWSTWFIDPTPCEVIRVGHHKDGSIAYVDVRFEATGAVRAFQPTPGRFPILRNSDERCRLIVGSHPPMSDLPPDWI